MKQAIKTRCYECGAETEGRRENYRYVESGLSSVVLTNVLVFRCKRCGAVVPQITAAAVLHLRIAMHLLTKETRLSGEEVRFLRKAVGYSATELAKMLGTSKAVVSRWENYSTLGQESDRLVRLICVNKMLGDRLLNADRSRIDEKDIQRAQELVASMDDTLRKLRKKKSHKKEQYMIDPADLSDYGCITGADAELDALRVQ